MQFCAASIREWLLLESGIKLGTKMKKSTASRKVEWLQTPVSQYKETLATAMDTKLEESDPFVDVEGDEDELEEKELVLETANPLYYAFYNPYTVTNVCSLLVLIIAIES